MLGLSLNTLFFGVVCTCLGSVLGLWSAWNAWGACSKTCGSGERIRTRHCTGSNCNVGLETDTAACNTRDCYCTSAFTEWGAWSKCSKDCVRSKTRTCQNVRDDCVSVCVGSYEQVANCTEDLSCRQQRCKQGDVYWDQWGPWDQCIMSPTETKTCGTGGYSVRRRTCILRVRPTFCPTDCSGIPGNQFDYKDCIVCCESDLALTPSAEWSKWNPWSVCSASCGNYGERTRSRSCITQGKTHDCLDPICVGDATETETCLTKCCDYTTETWGSWTEWGQCTKICGTGIQTQTRSCLKPPKNPTDPCASCGSDQKTKSCELRKCDGQYVCKDMYWNGWAPWSSCTTTCGGQKFSLRTCSPLGCDCPGDGIRKELCPGAETMQWSDWTDFGECLADCDQKGTMIKTRTCSAVKCKCSGTTNITKPCTGSSCDDTDTKQTKGDALEPITTTLRSSLEKDRALGNTSTIVISTIVGIISVVFFILLGMAIWCGRRTKSPSSTAGRDQDNGHDRNRDQQETNIVFAQGENVNVRSNREVSFQLTPLVQRSVGPDGEINLVVPDALTNEETAVTDVESIVSTEPSRTDYTERSYSQSEASSV